MSKNTTTKPLDHTKVRAVESLSWGGNLTVPRLRVAQAAKTTGELGIQWPAHTVDTIDHIAAALESVSTLTATRAPLTLDDLLADDATDRALTAIRIDEGGTRRNTAAQLQLLAAGINGMQNAITAAAPNILEQVAQWIEDHADQRHFAQYARNLPTTLAAKVGQWDTAIRAHSELIRITDPLAFEDLERNEEAHRIYAWTDQQWLDLHAKHDTLNDTKITVEWWAWNGLPDVTVNPARTTSEVAQRVTHANDIAQAWNNEHRPKQKLRWY